MNSLNGQSARYRKHLEYEAQLDAYRAMSLAVYLRILSVTNYGILYNPYDTDYAGFDLFLTWALRVDLLARSQSIEFQIGKRDCQFPLATWVVTFVSKYVLGLRHYSSLHSAIQDGYLRSLLGLESIPDVSSISRAHEDLHPRAMKHAYHDFIQKTVQEQKLIGHL